MFTWSFPYLFILLLLCARTARNCPHKSHFCTELLLPSFLLPPSPISCGRTDQQPFLLLLLTRFSRCVGEEEERKEVASSSSSRDLFFLLLLHLLHFIFPRSVIKKKRKGGKEEDFFFSLPPLASEKYLL